MKKKRHLLATILAGLSILVGTSRAEVICDKVRPLKPVRCVCGKLTDQTGGPVSGATVRVLQDRTELAAMKTAADGTFVFAELKSGNYEITASVDGLVPFRSPIVVINPTKKCRHGLAIVLVTSYPDNCGSYVVKR
jgi:hypothetical protein